MSHDLLITISIFAVSNVSALVGLYIGVLTKLTRIETDLTWIKKACPSCQLSSESHTP